MIEKIKIKYDAKIHQAFGVNFSPLRKRQKSDSSTHCVTLAHTKDELNRFLSIKDVNFYEL